MTTEQPKTKYSDLELEHLFFEKLHNSMVNIGEGNQRAILRDIRNKLKTLKDGNMKVNFTMTLNLNEDNEITIDAACQYDIKGSHKDKLERVVIKYEAPDLLDGLIDEPEEIEEDTNLLEGDTEESSE